MAVALFFFSCEDENTILGFKNPVPKFNVAFVDIPLTSNVHLIDSIITDNKTGSSGLLIGEYEDPTFGSVMATPALHINYATGTRIPSDAIFDSVTFSLRYNYYHYGFSGERTEKFAIHRLTSPLDATSTKRAYYNNTVAYETSPMAYASVTVKSDSLAKQYALEANRQDTLVATARLSQELGQKIFEYAQAYTFLPASAGDQTYLQNITDFNNDVKGLILIPQESDGILGIRNLNAFSGVTIHYRTLQSGAVKDTLSRFFSFGGPSYTNIKVERTGPLANLQPYQALSETSATGSRFIQSGNPVITKIDLANFYQFADTVGSIIVNEASLVIGDVESPAGVPPIGRLGLKVLNEDNQFSNYARRLTDRADLAPYLSSGAVIRDFNHLFVRSDIPSETASLATFPYANGQYSGYLTLFIQQLLRFRNDADGINEKRLKHLGLYPIDPSISASVNRTVFGAGNVKLRIYYTKPTVTTTP
ncbi:MAG TPA: DUF4270 family protein [Chryseosolibacter sp.]